MFTDKTCLVEVLTAYSGNIAQEKYTAFSGFVGNFGVPTSAIRMNIQPATPQMTLLVEGAIGKTFRGFTTASGLAEGMRVTVSGTNDQYIVRGRLNYDYGPVAYNEVILFKHDPL
jgi:hypothetical protein